MQLITLTINHPSKKYKIKWQFMNHLILVNGWLFLLYLIKLFIEMKSTERKIPS